MARIIALADDSIFFAVFSEFIGVALANLKTAIRARFSAIFSWPSIGQGKYSVFRMPIGLPDTARASLSTTTHIDRHDAR
ncbi:hypothetical protein [Burkholderia ambifaria]|uniref:hypothetical protein n=1 Tax=Burkholderia ambifaria TaxID=152480 RepID=UPI00158C176E|nr:hypothetical protein [Burkholderia ambifaria]